jgi:hypothetical protein
LLRTSSQSEHRAAFFLAVREGDELTAFKLVGRLREEAHDLGEVAFHVGEHVEVIAILLAPLCPTT